MKKITLLLKVVVLGLSLLMVSCSNDGAPEEVAKKFLGHINKLEFKEAKEFCDEKTASLLDMLAGLSGLAKDMPKDAPKIAEVEIVKTDIKDDVATVTYKQTEKGETKESKLILKKIDGQWKVSMNKEDAKKEEAKKMSEGMQEVTKDTTAPVLDSIAK
jgi:hypothetical protein